MRIFHLKVFSLTGVQGSGSAAAEKGRALNGKPCSLPRLPLTCSLLTLRPLNSFPSQMFFHDPENHMIEVRPHRGAAARS